MNLRLVVALVAGVLFVLAGFTAWNETDSGLRIAYMWFGLAMAAMALAIGLPGDRNRG